MKTDPKIPVFSEQPSPTSPTLPQNNRDPGDHPPARSLEGAEPSGRRRQTSAPLPAVFDAVIVGGGHAGCEAAMALARLGFKTLLLTMSITRLGHLSCNPAVGGLAKGHMVREIDALGGMMGLWTDEAGIQFRTLNTSKGPAVRATRVQVDRKLYAAVVQRDILAQADLRVVEDTAVDLVNERDENGAARVCGVRTAGGLEFSSRLVLLTTGTFLQGKLHMGEESLSGGRLGDPAAEGLSRVLADLGLTLGRFMTCTPPRIKKDGVDFSRLEKQLGDEPPPRFSFHGPAPKNPQAPCYVAYTTPAGHDFIRAALSRSAMTNELREGEGPRYCPSIEDKIVRFPDKERHQVFIEPEGLDSPWCYPNALPTGLPVETQQALINAMPGFERAEIAQPGYAIAYDYVPPTQLFSTLECKAVRGLYLAGQINGTSGYEEAAAQGLWAALNMACSLRNAPPFILGRDEAYMAVLVDDLVTKGTEEPYRMFTSRAEHRLLLRESNADARLTPKGRALGLVGDAQWALFTEKYAAVARLREALSSTRLTPDEPTARWLAERDEPAPGKALTLAELLRRPALSITDLAFFLPEIAEAKPDVLHETEVEVKYAGYLARQADLVARGATLEHVRLPADLDYSAVAGLSAEVMEKLSKMLPRTLGQAGRISGVTPAALACLQVHLKKLGHLQ